MNDDVKQIPEPAEQPLITDRRITAAEQERMQEILDYTAAGGSICLMVALYKGESCLVMCGSEKDEAGRIVLVPLMMMIDDTSQLQDPCGMPPERAKPAGQVGAA